MTEVGFYHLTHSPLERALPILLRKVYEAGLRAVVMAASEVRLEALDAALWTFEPSSFVPHGRARDGHLAEQPIFFTCAEENPNDATVLVLTEGVQPAFLEQFDRCLDLFDGGDDEQVAAARVRWKRLRAAGYPLTYWQQNPSGGWRKAEV